MSEIKDKVAAIANALPEAMFVFSATDFYDEDSGDVFMYRHEMTSIPEGFPTEIRGDFNCQHNKLTSLEGSPRKIGGNFACDYNKLTSLDGAPREIGGNFYCYGNARKFTEEEVRAVCKVGGKIYV